MMTKITNAQVTEPAEVNMIVLDNALLEMETNEKETIWEAMHLYEQYCTEMIKRDHCAKDIFAERREVIYDFIKKAYKPWERRYH